MVHPLSDRISRVPPYSIRQCINSVYKTLTSFGLASQPVPLSIHQLMANPVSLAATPGISIDFLSYGYLDVSVPRVRFRLWRIIGLPHSDIHGSTLVCNSPRLFAAYHVLRRLQEPRHPLYALLRFFIRASTNSIFISYSQSLNQLSRLLNPTQLSRTHHIWPEIYAQVSLYL